MARFRRLVLKANSVGLGPNTVRLGVFQGLTLGTSENSKFTTLNFEDSAESDFSDGEIGLIARVCVVLARNLLIQSQSERVNPRGTPNLTVLG